MPNSKRGQIPIPKFLIENYEVTLNVEGEVTRPDRALPILENPRAAQHPVDRIVGILDGILDDDFDIDEYIEETRGR